MFTAAECRAIALAKSHKQNTTSATAEGSLSLIACRMGQRLLVFQDGIEIAYVEPAFKEVQLNEVARWQQDSDPNARAPPCWPILRNEHCISDQQQPCPVRLHYRFAYGRQFGDYSVAFPHFKLGKME
jgi:hypothetical protein